MREEDLNEEIMALILTRRLITIQRWLRGDPPPRDVGLLREKLERQRHLIRNLREALRVIRG